MQLFEYASELCPAIFIKRYKRFFVDVERKSGLQEAVHCANSGSMKSCYENGSICYTLDSHNEERKLRHSLELIELKDGLVCVNTARANQCVKSFFNQLFLENTKYSHIIPSDFKNIIEAYNTFRAEAKYSLDTRFDFCLEKIKSDKKCWIEVKSISLKLDEKTLSFPDAVTERGRKHLLKLIEAKKSGDDAWLFFCIMRSSRLDVQTIENNFRIASEIDSAYFETFKLALKSGVRVALLIMDITLQGISLRSFSLKPFDSLLF